MGTCKAIIQEGPRKGEGCKFPGGENLYCDRHQRNYEHNKLVLEEKIPCRFFFRGCDNLLESASHSSCKSCRERISTKSSPCNHKGCKFKTNEKYCKKHGRDKYYDEEKENGIKYCDVARGCFTLCEDGLKSCRKCLDDEILRDNNRRKDNNVIHSALASNTNTVHQVCCNCHEDFEKYLTRYNKESKLCKSCNQKQQLLDDKRQNRKRNYKNENLKNLNRYYKQYIKSAIGRNYIIELQFEDFQELVKQKCHYCDYIKNGEANGVDRVDNSKGYTKENCVACCEICNRIKHVYHPQFFIEKCQILSKHKETSDDFYKKWDTYYYKFKPQNFMNYKNLAETKRNLKFNITKEDWDKLTQEPCYLCGYKNIKGIGLDRIDNTVREYNLDNVKPCCGSCNIMKHELNLDEFLQKARDIAIKWKDITILEYITITPPKNNTPKNEIVKLPKLLENRINWKSTGVLNSILRKTNEFYESQKDVFTEDENTELNTVVSTKSKEESIEYIKKLLSKLNKRRKRANN
jgi:hypothetical protein